MVLDGKRIYVPTTQTISNVKKHSNRIVPVPTSEIIVLAFQATTPGAGTFNEANVKYIRLTNKDSTNFIQLIFRSEGGAEFAVKLDALQTFIFNGDNSGGVVDVMDASASALTVAFEDLVDITAKADTAECDLEYFVAVT